MTSIETEQTFYRLLNPGKTDDGQLFVEITYDNRLNPTRPLSLSMSGIVGPFANGNCQGSCGQCTDALLEVTEYAPGWDRAMCERLHDLWDTWHLNTMQAGSPAQTAFVDAHENEFPGYPGSHYVWAKDLLAGCGLEPDPNYLHNGKPYSYGSAWLTIEVPPEILAELQALPASARELPGEWNHHR